jgi:hypothetical protein
LVSAIMPVVNALEALTEHSLHLVVIVACLSHKG